MSIKRRVKKTSRIEQNHEHSTKTFRYLIPIVLYLLMFTKPHKPADLFSAPEILFLGGLGIRDQTKNYNFTGQKER